MINITTVLFAPANKQSSQAPNSEAEKVPWLFGGILFYK